MLESLIIGLSIAAPVGPIGVLVIRRTLALGQLNGFVSGLGAATADTLYGMVAAFGLTAISSLLVALADPLRLFGGLFLAYLGYKTLTSRPSEHAAEAETRSGLLAAYLSVTALTLTNPMTILAFLGIFAGVGAGRINGEVGAALVMVLGVAVGSALWWLVLSGGIGLLRHRFTPRWMVWVNRVSGLVILAFAVRILISG
ncbi:MAG: LysE family translocator [Anaerolineae bacterium]|nr:LysE family translocator [Anaerolineae bacterium]